MTNPVSRRAKFYIPQEGIEQFVAMARARQPYRPHTIALLIFDCKMQNFVCGHPVKPRDQAASCAPVPVQQRFAGKYPRLTGEQLAKVVLRGAVPAKCVYYLGYGYGDHHIGEIRQPYSKYVHWFGVRAPSKIRAQGNEGLASAVTNLSEVESEADFCDLRWMTFRPWLSLSLGDAVSEAKTRMVLQATLRLAEETGVNNATVARAHQELTSLGVSPLPVSA